MAELRSAAHQRRTAARNARPQGGQPRGYGWRVADPEQQAAVSALLAALGPETELHMDALNGTLRLLRADLTPLLATDPDYEKFRRTRDLQGLAGGVLQRLDTLLCLGDATANTVCASAAWDGLGMGHVRLQLQAAGYPVFGAEVAVHFNAQGYPVQVNGSYAPSYAFASFPVCVSAAEATVAAWQSLGYAAPGGTPKAATGRLVYYWSPNRQPELTYPVTVAPRPGRAWQVFVSALDGRPVHTLALAHSEAIVGSGIDLSGQAGPFNCWRSSSTYYAVNTATPDYDAMAPAFALSTATTGRGAIYIQDYGTGAIIKSNSATAWDAAAVSAMHNLENTARYFHDTLGRVAINNDTGQRLNAIANVHETSDKDNAYWDGNTRQFYFGDGDTMFQKIAAALDVVAHEYTHGVTDFSARLAYENQSGALNEHFSDFFGAMVDRDDWVIGEGIVNTANYPDRTGLRDMSDPHNAQMLSWQPKLMSEYRQGSSDYGGVHTNSGIPNYASYLITAGPNGIGRDRAERLFYRALTVYLQPYAAFVDYRRALLSAAADLYGADSAEATVIAAACDTVGIVDTAATLPPGSVPATSGNDSFLVIGPAFYWYGGYAGDRIFTQDADGSLARLSDIGARRGSRPAVAGDGSWTLFVGTDDNIYWTDGTSTEVWTSTGNARTIAMSKDTRYITLTTFPATDTIAVVDTEGDGSTTLVLDVPVAGGDTVTLDYADVMSFNCIGDYMMFDALKTATVNGQAQDCWGIYALRLKDHAIFPLTPLHPGTLIGNPAMAHTRPYEMVADYIVTDAAGNEDQGLWVMDVLSGIRDTITTQSVLGQPSYRGDDAAILCRDWGGGFYRIWEGVLQRQSDGHVTVDTNSWQSVYGPESREITFPVGYRAGSYTPPRPRLEVGAALAFDEVTVGQPATRTVTLANSGSADLEIIAVTVEGPDAPLFTAGSLTYTRLPAGGTQELPVIFAPVNENPVTARLRIQSTMPEAADPQVALTGRGLFPTHTLTVVGGSGGGDYAPGASVTISAGTVEGNVFRRWTGYAVADAAAAVTTLLMPKTAATVTAEFVAADSPPLIDRPTVVWAGTPGRLAAQVSGWFDPADSPENCHYAWLRNGSLVAGASGPDFPLTDLGTGDVLLCRVWPVAANGTESAPVDSLPVTRLAFATGWNLVSLPLEPAAELSPAAALVTAAGQAPCAGPAWRWDTATRGLVTVERGLTTKTGYWLYLTAPAEVLLAGTLPADQALNLQAGWNLTGVCQPGSLPADARQVGGAWFWDAALQAYHYQSASAALVPTRGYWLFTAAPWNPTPE